MTDPNTSASVSAAPVKNYHRKARNILIHKPMQHEFSFVLIALLMVSTLAIGFVIHSTIREAAFSGYHFGKISAYEVLSEISYQLVVRVSAILFVTLVIVAVYGIFFLHRVAGPVYRFRQSFLKINDGEVPPVIRLREGDYFGETATEINRLITRIAFEKEKAREIKTKLNQLLTATPDNNASAVIKEIKELLQQECQE